MNVMMDKEVYERFIDAESIHKYIALMRDPICTDINANNLFATRVLDAATAMEKAFQTNAINSELMPDRCVAFLVMIASEEIAKYEASKEEHDNGN